MKKKIFFAVVLTMLAAFACADTTVDFNFGLFTEPADRLFVDGVRLNIIYGRAQEINGASVGMVNITEGKLTGVECGFVNIGKDTYGARTGFVNILDGAVTGALTGFVNNTGNVTGVITGFVNNTGSVNGTLTGFVNNSDGGVTGVVSGFVNVIGTVNGMESGFINMSKEINGYTVGFVNSAGTVNGIATGLVNVTDKTTGIMTGVVNICGDLKGAAIGAVNIIKGGFGKISLYSTTESLYNVAFKSGKGFYGILAVGYDARQTRFADKYTAAGGLGYHYDLKPFFIDYEALNNIYFKSLDSETDWENDISASVELRILPGINFGDIIDIYAGPSVKYYSEGNLSRRDSWNWAQDKLRISAVAGVSIRVF